MVEQELCVGLLLPPLPSHQRCLRNLKRTVTVGTCYTDCRNTEGHVVRKEPLCPAMGFFCAPGFGGYVQAALRGCQTVLGPPDFRTGLDGHRDLWLHTPSCEGLIVSMILAAELQPVLII